MIAGGALFGLDVVVVDVVSQALLARRGRFSLSTPGGHGSRLLLGLLLVAGGRALVFRGYVKKLAGVTWAEGRSKAKDVMDWKCKCKLLGTQCLVYACRHGVRGNEC